MVEGTPSDTLHLECSRTAVLPCTSEQLYSSPAQGTPELHPRMLWHRDRKSRRAQGLVCQGLGC